MTLERCPRAAPPATRWLLVTNLVTFYTVSRPWKGCVGTLASITIAGSRREGIGIHLFSAQGVKGFWFIHCQLKGWRDWDSLLLAQGVKEGNKRISYV